MEFDLENPITDSQDHHHHQYSSLFLSESDHMPLQQYYIGKVSDFDISVRQETIPYILHICCSCNLGPFVSYLAINYLDRFLSSQGILQSNKPWVFKLIAMSCVSLAVKMKKTEFSVTDFQVDGGLIFDVQTIERMEYIILDALKWRMRSITPFSFISLFLSFFKLKDPPLLQALKARAIEIIFKAQNDTNLLWFKPSVIAGSALLSASHELFPLQFSCFNKAISNYSYVNKETLSQCYKLMQEVVVNEYQSKLDTWSSCDTTVNVLDKQFSSSQSDETTMNMLIKRREMKGDYDCSSSNQTVKISQIEYC
ncbi:putative cyclin-D6-1 [Rutidosis leptorrhynchoides]|uniref:putative cyclin-D6-1 n=1 Tax=Rutidosis leptorrhynchoides TaxID=125765 RepID=UPI003A99B2BD